MNLKSMTNGIDPIHQHFSCTSQHNAMQYNTIQSRAIPCNATQSSQPINQPPGKSAFEQPQLFSEMLLYHYDTVRTEGLSSDGPTYISSRKFN